MKAIGAMRLKRRIVMFAVGAMMAVGTAVAAACIVPLQAHMTAAADHGLAHALDLRVIAVGEALSRLRDLARQITSRTVIRDALVSYNQGEWSLGRLRSFTADKLEDALKLAPEMVGIVRLDRDGKPVVSVGETVPPGLIRPVMEGFQPVIDPPFRVQNGVRLIVRAPILGRDGGREGTDVVLFDAAAVRNVAVDDAPLGASGETVLVVGGRDGYRLVFRRTREGVHDPVEDLAPTLREALDRSRTGTSLVKAQEEDGSRVVMAARVPDSGWIVAVSMAADELYYDVNRLLVWVAAGAGGLILLGTLGLLRVVGPLAGRMLVQADDLAQQVAEQGRTLDALQRTHRALRTLSAGNQVLVHARSEETLFADMCRVAVDTGGYAFAWAGLLEGERLRVVACHARAGTRVRAEAVAAAWSAVPSVPELLRLVQPLIVSDTANDPRFAGLPTIPEDGCAAFLLPLADPLGEPLGVIAIHGPAGESFDEQERALLIEMAGDLAFGIATLRTQGDWQRGRDRLERALEGTIRAVAATIEVRDPYTAGHQRRVGEIAAAIARALGLSEHRIKGVYVAGIIHDIGKTAVPAEILGRPGPLTETEFELVKAHPTVASDILRGVEFPWPVGPAIVQHHERLDGSGYPLGLKGEAICLEARILAVADVVEAMASHRPYRPALGSAAAVEEIQRHRGTLFDPAVVDACVGLIEDGAISLAVDAGESGRTEWLVGAAG